MISRSNRLEIQRLVDFAQGIRQQNRFAECNFRQAADLQQAVFFAALAWDGV
jgi:hypothetical protein